MYYKLWLTSGVIEHITILHYNICSMMLISLKFSVNFRRDFDMNFFKTKKKSTYPILAL